jgi:hypothetical protein
VRWNFSAWVCPAGQLWSSTAARSCQTCFALPSGDFDTFGSSLGGDGYFCSHGGHWVGLCEFLVLSKFLFLTPSSWNGRDEICN